MFNNIIYFIIVLLIFNISFEGNSPHGSFLFSTAGIFCLWIVFALYCRRCFHRMSGYLQEGQGDEGRATIQYQSLLVRLSILAIFFFAIDIYVFNLKFWLRLIPGFQTFSVLEGLSALALFVFHLGTIWYFAYPAYQRTFRAGLTRRSFLRSNIRLNVPILFPWIAISLFYDLAMLTPWAQQGGFLTRTEGQFLFFSIFLVLLMVFLPAFLQRWWGCTPLQPTEKTTELERFLNQNGFHYNSILNWPIFEGRMMTAGVMGVVGRYRYILVTESLMAALSINELKAVVAHEMGHIKYRHLPFYLLFFIGFMVLFAGLFDLLPVLLAASPQLVNALFSSESQTINLVYLFLSIPLLLALLAYFRFLMGYFMRNFERQADLYSARMMKTPTYTIGALEKIAFFSGKSRELPSWHHFSVKQRVDFLLGVQTKPHLGHRHNRRVKFSLLTYLALLVGLGYLLNFSTIKRDITYALTEGLLSQQVNRDPGNPLLYETLAMMQQQMGNYREAIENYAKVIELQPNNATSLNNLAWLLVTAPDEALRDQVRALDLAKKAVAFERAPVFLDTLAETYYANGLHEEAIDTIREAIRIAKNNQPYYERQLKKFLSANR
jgi:Zn-dependent protease with chaperone function